MKTITVSFIELIKTRPGAYVVSYKWETNLGAQEATLGFLLETGRLAEQEGAFIGVRWGDTFAQVYELHHAPRGWELTPRSGRVENIR